MAKRFTDTDKWKKSFIKSLPVEYKLFWLFLLDECDHSGIWHVEIEIAELRLGIKLSKEKIRGLFGEKVVEFDSGHKLFIPDFITFQYGTLNPSNRVHASIIFNLNKYKLMGHISPLQGAKDKDMVMDKDMDKDLDKDLYLEGGMGETNFDSGIVPDLVAEFQKIFPKYPVKIEKDYPAALQIAYAIADENGWEKQEVSLQKREDVKLRWGEILAFVAADKWFSKRSISDLWNEWQRLSQSISNGSNFKNSEQLTGAGLGTSDARIKKLRNW